jgi:hypothetical protein
VPLFYPPDSQTLVVNAKDFGATGNGTTNDAPAIQAAIAACGTAGGGTVYLPAGNYAIQTGLTITTSAVSLAGAGAGASIIQTPSGYETLTMLLVGNGTVTITDVSISDLQFLGVTQKTANSAVQVQKGLRTRMQRLRVVNQHRALYVYNSVETWINDCDITNANENGITYEATVTNGFDCYVSNVYASCPGVTNAGIGISWIGGENFVVNNCDIKLFNEGLSIAPPTGNQCRYGFFSTTNFAAALDNCVKVTNSSGGDVVGLTFSNSGSISAVNYGVLLDGSGTGAFMGVRMVGHKSLRNGLAGFRLSGGSDVSLLGCDAIANSQTTTNTRNGIEIANGIAAAGSFSIIGCRCGNGWQQGSTQSNGISFDAATYNSGLIINNDLRGNANTSLYLNTATGNLQIKNNQGYNPVGALTAPAVPATTVAYTNTTGFDVTVIVAGGTVTAIAIGGTATGLTTGLLRVPANQTITLTYSVAPTWKWFAD